MGIAAAEYTITELSDGQTTYTWIKYADDEDGNGISDNPTGKRYFGIAYNKTTPEESTVASDYLWSPLYDNVEVGARNLILIKLYTYNYYLNEDDGTLIYNDNHKVTGYTEVTSNTEYTVSSDPFYNLRYVFYDSDKMFISGFIIPDETYKRTFTTPSNTSFVRISSETSNLRGSDNWKLEKGNIATDWTPAPEDIEDDYNDKINNVTTEYQAAIDVSSEEISLSVDEKITNSEGRMINYTDTEVQATKDSFNISFSEMQTTVDGHGTDISEMHSYFKFQPSGLNIGKSDSPLQINISNSQMDFIDNGQIVAYVNGQKMYISSLEVLNELIVGNHKIEKYNNNITLIKWVGG